MTRILTIEQAAEMLHLNPQVVRQYLREGKLPGTKIGRHWRIAEDQLLDFIRAEHQQKSAADLVAETATKYPDERPWDELSPEEKMARVKAVRGSMKGVGRSSEEFMREKHEETEQEERQWEERHKK